MPSKDKFQSEEQNEKDAHRNNAGKSASSSGSRVSHTRSNQSQSDVRNVESKRKLPNASTRSQQRDFLPAIVAPLTASKSQPAVRKSATVIEINNNDNEFRCQSAPESRHFSCHNATTGKRSCIFARPSNQIVPMGSKGHCCPASMHNMKGSTRANGATMSSDSFDDVCRICHDNPSKMELIMPCLCRGSMGLVHRSCLERWLGESGKNACEICGFEYKTVRTPKYYGFSSLCAWIRHPLTPSDSKNLFFDLGCFLFLTPLSILAAWLCIIGARHYGLRARRITDTSSFAYWNLDDNDNSEIDALWTCLGLIILTVTLFAAYSVWLFVVARYHVQIWREWRSRNFVVTILPFDPHNLINDQHVRSDIETTDDQCPPGFSDIMPIPSAPPPSDASLKGGTRRSTKEAKPSGDNKPDENSNQYPSTSRFTVLFSQLGENSFTDEELKQQSTSSSDENQASGSNIKPRITLINPGHPHEYSASSSTSKT